MGLGISFRDLVARLAWKGDIAALGQLAWQLYKTCEDTPESLKTISQEIFSLHGVLKDLEETYSGALLSATQQSRLENIRSRCRAVLEDLQDLVDRYNSLVADTKHTWDRLGWRSDDIAELRYRLVSTTVLLTAFVNTSQFIVQKRLDVFLQEFQHGEHKGSIISSQTLDSLSTDEKHAWRTLRSELEDIGISIAAFDANKDFIVNWFRTTINREAFAKQTAKNKSTNWAIDLNQSFTDDLSLGFTTSPGFTPKSKTYRGIKETMRESKVQMQKSLGSSLLGPPPRLWESPILECPFNLLSCFRTFSSRADWISHSLAHFGNVEPPRANVCCFCSATFTPSTGIRSWTDRMIHVSFHHKLGHTLASARPDFELFTHLWKHRLITGAEYRILREKYGRPPTVLEPGKKDKALDTFKERVKIADLSPSELQDPMGHIRDEIELNISTFPKDFQNATFHIDWDLRKYIRQELEEDQNLKHILTVSGSAKKAYSTTCVDYMSKFWPETGPWMLEVLQVAFDRGVHHAKLATNATDSIVVDVRNISDSSMTFDVTSSRKILIGVAQQLAWLAAISKISSFQELTYSHVLLRYVGAKEFIITVLDNLQLPKGDEMCWHPLFPNTVIAYGFPVPSRSAEMGVEIPFDVMLRLARITYAVTYDDGLVLSGFSTLLFPSAHHKPQSQAETQSNSVQWHLVTRAHDHTRISAGVELAQHDHLWVKINDEELLRSARTFLGHCKVSCVHLGTKNSGFSDVSQSSLADDKSNPAISVRSGTIGTSGMGILGAAMNVEAILPRGLARLTKIDSYNDILRTAKNMPIILYDADKQQAWLVPALSIILHMAHAWKAKYAPKVQLPYAKPDWDGGQAAFNIIAESSRLELERSLEDDTPYFLKDLVKRLWEHLISCFDCTNLDTRRGRGTIEFGNPKLRGWEYRDIIDPPPVCSKMKEQILDRSGCGWENLTEDVLLLVCKGLGEVIQPAKPGALCAEIYPVQRGMKYLTASVACLRHLSQTRGMGETCIQLADHVFWPPPSPNLFDDCTHGDDQPCHKALQRLVPKEVHGPATAVPAEGAVLFGHKTNKLKRKASGSFVKKLSKKAVNGHVVESANQGFVVNATHRSAGHSDHLLANGDSTVPSSQTAYSEDIPGFSSLALADEQCTGSSNQEMTEENTPRPSAQSIPKLEDEFRLWPRSHIWRRLLYR